MVIPSICWGTGWKLIHMHARMARQKLFHLAAAVDRMLIPHHHHRSCDVTQQMHEKPDHLLPADRVTIGLQMQLDLAFPWTHAQSANQVQALMVVKTRETVGVCLRGAHVRLSGETSENPLSSEKTRVTPSLRHFFYLWPAIAFPMSDRDLVSCQTPPLWLLTTPTESSQEIPNTARTVPYAKLVPDHQ